MSALVDYNNAAARKCVGLILQSIGFQVGDWDFNGSIIWFYFRKYY